MHCCNKRSYATGAARLIEIHARAHSHTYAHAAMRGNAHSDATASARTNTPACGDARESPCIMVAMHSSDLTSALNLPVSQICSWPNGAPT